MVVRWSTSVCFVGGVRNQTLCKYVCAVRVGVHEGVRVTGASFSKK
jgi:hypothetical protein